MQSHDSDKADNATPGNLARVLSVLELLTEEELRHLNQVVVQRLRLMQDIRAYGHMQQFRIGQRVRFTAAAGQLIRGTITRQNRKSVSLVTAEGVQWRVAPHLLQADD